MSKAAQIREAMGNGGGSATDIAQRAGVDVKAVSVFVANGVTKGEVVKSGEKGAYTFTLNADYTPGRKGPTKRPKRMKGFKGASKERKKLREIAAKAKQKAPGAGEMVQCLAAAAVLAQARQLAARVRSDVEDLESAPDLLHALTSYEMAESIHQAAKGLA